MKIIKDYDLIQLENYGFMNVDEFFYWMKVEEDELIVKKMSREILINNEYDADKLLKLKVIQQMLKDKIIIFENN